MTIPILLTRTHFEKAFTPAALRAMAILQTALIAGPLVYVVPMLIVMQNAGIERPVEADFSVLNALSMIHVVALFAALFLGNLLFYRMFSPSRLAGMEELGEEKLAFVAAGHLRSAVIVRLALLEGAAFLGIAVCVVGITRGILDAEPLYYLNLGSLLVLLIYGLMTFPTKKRILSWFEERFR